MISSFHIIQNLSLVQSKIETAAFHAGRKIKDIKIVAVTKANSPK